MISSLISRLSEEDTCVELLSRFDRLLKKYSRLLSHEDAYEELRLFFIELVTKLKNSDILHKGDGYLVNNISASVKHHYIALSKGNHNSPILLSEVSDEQKHYLEYATAQELESKLTEYFPCNEALSERERSILIMHFVQGYSISEIAARLGISRQAVNQAKVAAINKIKRATIF